MLILELSTGHLIHFFVFKAKLHIFYKIDDASGVQFEGGKKYTYTIKLSGGNLVVVSVKIKDWEDVQKTGTADLETSN